MNEKPRIKSITYVCKHCGIEYHPKERNRATYCSRECAYADRKANSKERKKPVCIICGKEFTGRLNCKYCSDICRKKVACLKAQRASKHRYISLVKERVCKECGHMFVPKYGTKKRVFCSLECRRKHSHKEYKALRKQQMKAAYVESVCFEKIYKRDKGMCQICGMPVKHDKEPSNARAATIDHIVPLSKGGKHHQGNCQLAHRICNSVKGDKIVGAI